MTVRGDVPTMLTIEYPHGLAHHPRDSPPRGQARSLLRGKIIPFG